MDKQDAIWLQVWADDGSFYEPRNTTQVIEEGYRVARTFQRTGWGGGPVWQR